MKSQDIKDEIEVNGVTFKVEGYFSSGYKSTSYYDPNEAPYFDVEQLYIEGNEVQDMIRQETIDYIERMMLIRCLGD